ncbi:acetyltransferase [Vibrio lentus]
MTKCAILGASGHGKVVAEIAELNGYKNIHFYDDRWPKLTEIEHWQVVGSTDTLLAHCVDYNAVIVAIGHNQTRLQKQSLLSDHGAKFLVLAHPSAILSKYAQIGDGSVLMAGSVVNPFSRLGRSCIINTNASVDHDCALSDGVHISPGASLAGGVHIGTSSWIGINATVKQLVKVGSQSVIAAGAAVIYDVVDYQIMAGVPAQPLSSKD